MADHNIGKVVQVIGPVLDVEFESEHLPELYNALTIDQLAEGGTQVKLAAEVQQHIGRNQVRAVAMSTTDGVERGMDVTDTGSPITVPVGAPALGRILNVLGEPVDNGAPIPKDALRWPIHRPRPEFVDLEPKTEIFETGIKVIDLDRAVREGRQDRSLRRRRRRQDGRHSGADQQRRRRGTAASRCSAAWASARAKETISISSSRKRGFSIPSRSIYGQMNEPPGARLRVGLSGLTVAEYFRDVENAGRAAVHRQHLPLHAGRLRSVRAAGPHAERRRIPADARDGDGRSAGAHHVDEERLDHVGAGDLRSRRRHHRSGAGHRVRAPRRDGRAQSRASRSSASIRPSIRSTRRSRILAAQYVGERHYDAATGVQRILQRYKELQDIIAILGMDELSRRRQAHRRPRAPCAALHVAAVRGGRAVHGHPGQVRQARGDDRVVRARRRGRVRRAARSRRSSWSARSTKLSRTPRRCKS